MKFLLKLLFLTITFVPFTHADVYKCKSASGKISYQVSPCPTGAASENVVKTQDMTPEQREEANNKLKFWQESVAAEEEAKLKAEKERLEMEQLKNSQESEPQDTITVEQPNHGGFGFPHPPWWGGGYPYMPYGNGYHPPHPPYPPHLPYPNHPQPQPPVQPIAPNLAKPIKLRP